MILFTPNTVIKSADVNLNFTTVIETIYPIGSIYISVVSTNPSTLFGVGTWTAFGTGRAIVGIDTGQAEFNTIEKTGGAKTHTLNTTEMPSHNHVYGNDGAPGIGGGSAEYWPSSGSRWGTSYSGGNGAHNNLQPYITTYMWKRTA